MFSGTSSREEVARSGVGADRACAAVPAAADHTRADDRPRRQRLPGLDGVRGIAALYVVVNHVVLRAFSGFPAVRAPFWARWFVYGRFAVVVFIVLSGFSLALAPARRGWRLAGVGRFARRRARRILPPYYAALAFSLAIAWLIVAPPQRGGMPGGSSVIVNGLLVQNLIIVPSPNRSFWSIAVEAQLYIAFPLLLLLVRRWSAAATVAAVAVVVVTVGIVGPHVASMRETVLQSPPELVVLFVIGIAAAGVVGAGRAGRAWPLPWIALALVVPPLAMMWAQGSVWTLEHLFWVDLALGPPVACLFAALAGGRPAALVRVLDARPLRTLGDSSYSLYLTHGPIVVVVYEKVVAGRVAQGVPAFLVSLVLVLPLTILFARGFAAVFETPFRSARMRPAAPDGSVRARLAGPLREAVRASAGAPPAPAAHARVTPLTASEGPINT